MIKGQTFANQKIRDEDLSTVIAHCAILDDGALEGIGTGVTITNNGGVFTLGAGKILCQGRIVDIEQNSQILIPIGASANIVKGYLILKIDLSKEPPDIDAEGYNGTTAQCVVTYKEGIEGGDFPALTQNNLNDNGSIFELPLVSYNKTNTGFSNVTRVLKTLHKNNVGNGYVEKAVKAQSIEYTTTLPTSSPAEGTLIIYTGTTVPTTKYERVLYLIGY